MIGRGAMDKDYQISTFLILFLALLFGAFVRILPVLQAGFPLNDGGLFYTMISDLQKANYALPAATTYNQLHIPYAYPPLTFFLAGFIADLTRAGLIATIQWLPVFFSLLTIPAFYLLAKELLDAPLIAALATLIYALLPRSYEWVIMGGGVTRAPAALFLILMTWGVYRMFRHGGWKNYSTAILFAALVILTHPERALHGATTAALLWLFFGRSKAGLKRAAIVAVGVLTLTAPWWVTALVRYGWEPFTLAFQAGGERWLFWSPLLLLNFTDESIALVALLAVVGVAACLFKKKPFLPAWLALAFLADPRSAPHVASVQTSLLAAVGLSDIIFPALKWLGKTDSPPEEEKPFLAEKRGRWAFGYLLLMLLVNAMLNIQLLKGYVLSSYDRSAMQWIAASTPSSSRFVALTWDQTAGLSPMLEWFPALTDRTNISTIQGREWLAGNKNYNSMNNAYSELFSCLFRDRACIEEWASKLNEPYDYVYISLAPGPDQAPQQSSLSTSLMQFEPYQVVYQNPAVIIFKSK